jgi:putative Mn2+ efflux pump MntP
VRGLRRSRSRLDRARPFEQSRRARYGFTIGLLHLSLWLAVVLIGAQAFLFSQLGLRLGARLNGILRERAEQLAGIALLGLAALLAVEKLT